MESLKVKDGVVVEAQNDGKGWLPVVCQAIREEHNTLVARLCTLLEAVLPTGAIADSSSQGEATKRMLKDIVREEQSRINDYLETRAYPGDRVVPAEYKRFWVLEHEPRAESLDKD